MIQLDEICQTSDVWDRRTLAMWHSAQERHHNKIKIFPKDSRIQWFSFITWIVSLINSFFCGISAVFDRKRTIVEGFREGWKETPNFVTGEFTTFGYNIYVPGNGLLLKILPSDQRFQVVWHQICHIDFIYLGYPLEAERYEEQPKRGYFRRLYDELINANIVRFMWVAWRLPFGHATFRQEFEYIGFLCESRVEVYQQNGSASDLRKAQLAELFSGPEYGYMSTRRAARTLANDLVDKAANEYRNGWIDAKFEDLDRHFRSVQKWSMIQ